MTRRNKGHGRIEVRTIQVRSELQDHLEFPHAHQVFRIHRQVSHLKSGKVTEETAYGVTSLTREQASPDRLLSSTPSASTDPSRPMNVGLAISPK